MYVYLKVAKEATCVHYVAHALGQSNVAFWKL